MYHTLGSHTGRAVGFITHFALFFYNEFDTFAKKLTTVTHFGHPPCENAVRYVNFVMLISEFANVSHIWLPYWVRSRVTHSVCIAFYNDFITFALKLSILLR